MTLPQDWQKQIDDGQSLRGWIVNSFAQVEYLLRDLILRCGKMVEYENSARSLPHGAADRIKRVRSMLNVSGPLDVGGAHLSKILDHLESQQDTRNLLVHGFMTILTTPRGELGFHFQKFHRSPERPDARLVKTFTLQDLEDERDEQATFADGAIRHFKTLHERLGWHGPLADFFKGDEPFK